MCPVPPSGEESSLLLLDLPENCPLPAPGSRLTLQGLDAPNPSLCMPDGTCLTGELEVPIGSYLLLSAPQPGQEVEVLGVSRAVAHFGQHQPQETG